MLSEKAITQEIARFFEEDDLYKNFYYLNKLPTDLVNCKLKLKSDMLISGMPAFISCFKWLGYNQVDQQKLLSWEGREFISEDYPELSFDLPFSIALTGERIALNLLQHMSSISTFTRQFVDKAEKLNISILDTRKTTPGLRAFEKYAVRVGGGRNHRFSQCDTFMIKDNHKTFFGGIEKAINFFKNVGSFYTPVEVEIHNIDELKVAMSLGVTHIMLDNFSPEQVRESIPFKKDGVTFELSGGINLSNIETYLIPGIDAISVGALTYNAPHVDISMKYNRHV